MTPTLYGYRVIVTPDQPRRQLSARVCEVLAPAFIAETNAWMREFFGTTNMIEDGRVLISDAASTVYCNPRMFEQLKQAAGPALKWPDPFALSLGEIVTDLLVKEFPQWSR